MLRGGVIGGEVGKVGCWADGVEVGQSVKGVIRVGEFGVGSDLA